MTFPSQPGISEMGTAQIQQPTLSPRISYCLCGCWRPFIKHYCVTNTFQRLPTENHRKAGSGLRSTLTRGCPLLATDASSVQVCLLCFGVQSGPQGHTENKGQSTHFMVPPFHSSLSQNAYTHSWKLPLLPGKHWTVSMVAVATGNIGIGIVGIGASQRMGAWVMGEVLQEDG